MITPEIRPPVTEPSRQSQATFADRMWDDDGMSFGDVLDTVNPLQHLPVVSTIYRHVTGDQIGNAPRLIGGTLMGAVMGGPLVGLGSALLNVFVRESSGKDLGEHVADLIDPGQDQPTVIASVTDSRQTHDIQTMVDREFSMGSPVSGGYEADSPPVLETSDTAFRIYRPQVEETVLNAAIDGALQENLWEEESVQVVMDRYRKTQTTSISAAANQNINVWE